MNKVQVTYLPLRVTLAEKGVSISRMCEDLNISSTIRAKLNGDTDVVSLSTIAKICAYLNVPIEKVVAVNL